MNLYKFITQEELKLIVQAIKNKEEFEIENKYKNHAIWIKNSIAGVDFYDGTKKGDYIVLINYSTIDSGSGGPVSGKKLKGFQDINNLKEYLDKFLERRNIKGYEITNEGQISLFELMGIGG